MARKRYTVDSMYLLQGGANTASLKRVRGMRGLARQGRQIDSSGRGRLAAVSVLRRPFFVCRLG